MKKPKNLIKSSNIKVIAISTSMTQFRLVCGVNNRVKKGFMESDDSEAVGKHGEQPGPKQRTHKSWRYDLMTPGEPAVAYADEDVIDLSGFEAATAEPAKPSGPLVALYRLRAAALQMIANENDREAEAARERLRLDRQIQDRMSFDWSRPSSYMAGAAVAANDSPDLSSIVWEDEDTYFVW